MHRSHPPPELYRGNRGGRGRSSHLFRRPTLQHPWPPPLTTVIPPWKQWESLAINLGNVPLDATTFTLWRAFNHEGPIFSIDLFENSHGKREGRGKIRFRPPPKTDFWRAGSYAIKLEDGRTAVINLSLDIKHQAYEIPSPVRPNISYPAEIELSLEALDVGLLVDEFTMLPMRSVDSGMNEKASLVLDLKRKTMVINFRLPTLQAKNQSSPSNDDAHYQYRLKIPFAQLTKILQTQDSVSDCICHFTFLETPPIYHRRTVEVNKSFFDKTNWKESDMWLRQTDIVLAPQELRSLPTSLRKSKPLIDIGRWKAFKITYPKNSNDKGAFTLLCSVLSDFNVRVESTDHLPQWDRSKEIPQPIWKWIDYDESRQHIKSTSSLHDLIDEHYVHLPFPVRYQLEVCLSHGYLCEFTMTRDFAARLLELGEAKARKLLEHVAAKKQVYYDPMAIFEIKFIRGATDARIPAYCCYMRSARVTPSTVYFNTPTVEISNRVIRHYIEYVDRFLRVRFTDEKLQGRINSTMDNTMDPVFTRIKRTLANGIVIGDRRYEFLAFGNSQFREHGAYFFAPLPNITAATIRAWMGHFNNIRNIAKHAARLGQCFSTTRAVTGCSVDVREIEDVERNGYIFSDGVGRISKFLAQMAMSDLKIKTPSGEPPSAFQFRLGGCKGMLTVSSQAQRREVHIRKSQYKFAALHNGLEIIRWSQFSMATLNRQLIMVLSTLGLADEVFHKKLKVMLTSLEEAKESDSQAIYLLKKYVDPNQMTLVISQMVLDGFRKSKEPFLTSLLILWRAWHLKYLKEKAKIVLDQGACLLGCMDEIGVLKGYFSGNIPDKDATYEQKFKALPEIFVQVLRPDGNYKVIEGPCLLCRNPSLHPGDIRVVRAVDAPQLYHLQDVVVFPQTGDRDIASMCSGGDLDGDDYLVIWDPDLLPDDWFRTPMKYESNRAHDLERDVTVDDITSFFVTYMKNDCLPRIAHAHLAWADRLEDGVNEDKCIQLAQLHSDAVDYNKTGTPAKMTRSLQPPKWPHFMEKKYKPKHAIYRSGKILGQLYDAVERVDYVPNLEMPFDERILNCNMKVSDELTQFARDLKDEYDAAMRRIMAQHEIKTEFEVWSTFVLSHANMSKDYKFHEELGGISSSLREGFRKTCHDKVGGCNFEQLAPLAIAMYRVTHEEVSAALKKHNEKNPQSDMSFHRAAPRMKDLPLISFPWLLPNILGKIALRHYEAPETLATDITELENLPQKDASVKGDSPADTNIIAAPGSQFTQENAQPAEQDLLGLICEGETKNTAQPRSEPGQDNNQTSTNENSPEYSDLLGNCNFLHTPTLLPSNVASPMTNPTDNQDDLIGDLMSLSLNPRNEPMEGGDAKQSIEISDQAFATFRTEDLAGLVVAGGEDSGCIEIVEEEGDIKPSALDMLNELLGE